MIETLRQRNFTLFWIGQLISQIGDWVLWIALPFYVYEQTGSALATGTMFIVTNLPPLLFSSFAGVFVDRWNRKNTMIAADLLRALIIFLLLTTHSPDSLWLLYPLAFTQSIVSQFFRPAQSAILPTLVKQESLVAANTLTSMSGDLAMMIGPAISGLLYNVVGLTGIVLIDTASFVVSALLIWLIQLPPDSLPIKEIHFSSTQRAILTRTWSEWIAGLALVKQNPIIFTLFIVTGLGSIGNGIILVSWVVHVRDVLGGGATEYGWVQVAVATGGILAGFCLTTIHRWFSPRQIIAVSGIIVGLLLLTTFNVRSLPLILGLQLFMGVAAIGFYVPIETLLQSSTNKDFLGRIFGTYGTTSALLVLVGQGMASLFTDRLGTTFMLDIAAIMAFLGGVYALMLPSNKTYPAPSSDAQLQ